MEVPCSRFQMSTMNAEYGDGEIRVDGVILGSRDFGRVFERWGGGNDEEAAVGSHDVDASFASRRRSRCRGCGDGWGGVVAMKKSVRLLSYATREG